MNVAQQKEKNSLCLFDKKYLKVMKIINGIFVFKGILLFSTLTLWNIGLVDLLNNCGKKESEGDGYGEVY
ncbi:hypothetical protein WAK64_15895 [Bacillus spongiae]|uniref:Uncharacterized protein n=1 Tax=Bacillus spongiae TaxID=2683610 RepID=A0ABU8HGL5_9BACI